MLACGNLGKLETIISTAASHHRLLRIHPFLDGNGRVARLMSHAILLETPDTGGIWSVARGLAQNVRTYKHHLAEGDLTRRNDLDGKGHLSEEALASLTRFFLSNWTLIDQLKAVDSRQTAQDYTAASAFSIPSYRHRQALWPLPAPAQRLPGNPLADRYHQNNAPPPAASPNRDGR
ncbi:MAG: Fic family protein [Candidatus Thiodiazotropha sp. (ex Dulcina madagascariensis)]|nr:Fic family protein [Candidatus Thiodiazotropha sp. (ex Dulcina madagascariensis)]MCU7928574.1 Fic family protein [Candidatus Thiodiazotropha sp. (ex Dulcina madagascariensis)]